jgi:L-ascorbate metabolism protein UlaG (beta-lactamase superfamily)
MSDQEIYLTYVGGPTALIEFCGLRLLTDPTFDPPGRVYGNLTKTMGPALAPAALGRVDVVLLSHDHHADNLDDSGREFLNNATQVLTTNAGAERLNGNVIGLAPWEPVELTNGIKVTATPGRHGPAHMERGPVIGFVLGTEHSHTSVYISGDTVWYEGVAEVAKRFDVSTAILFMGAAQVDQVGPWPLTMTAEDGLRVAHAMPTATIVPLHFEGWKHFSQSREFIDRAFQSAGLLNRLKWPQAGTRVGLSF